MDKYVICILFNGFTDQIRYLITALNIRENYNRHVKLDISWFEEFGKDYLGIENRKQEALNIFNDLNFEIATKEEIEIAKNSLFVDGRYNENVDEILKINKHIYIGSYVSHLYNFKKQIDISSVLNLDKYFYSFLSIKHKDILKDINNHESVALHIRRGDYLYTLRMANIENKASINYIIKSINYFYDNYKNVKIYIFSNNQEYIEDNIIRIMDKYKYNYKIIKDNSEYIDFYLISKCKHTISTLGKFADVAFLFNNNKNKIFISVNNIYGILKKNFEDNIKKYSKYIIDEYINIDNEIYKNIKPYISNANMIYIFNLIERNKINNICQIGLLDGFETRSLLKYSVSNKKFTIHCFENNERDISGIEIREFSKEENNLFKLYINSSPLDCENILYKNVCMDMILFTKEISNPLVLMHLIYLFPYMNNEVIVILKNLSYDLYDSFNNFIFNISNCEKEIFYNYEENRYDDVGYIKINKNELLNIIKLASNIKFDNKNILFYDKIIDLREDYFNYFNIEKAYSRIEKLKKYMDHKFDADYTDYIINNLYKHIDLYIKNMDIYHKIYNKVNEFNLIKIQIDELKLINKEISSNLSLTKNEISSNLSLAKNEINNKIDLIKKDLHNTENYSKAINKKIDILINFIAWWIPIKKWRDNFRNKFIEH